MELLYIIFILPIESIIRLFLEAGFGIAGSYGIAIVFTSIAVNLALIPIYNRAEKWRAKDKELQDRMKNDIDKIKKSYKGQEAHFYTQTIHRRFGYHPLSSLKASAGFLLQIPFFFAAFHLLSNYEAFNGASFWFLGDLAKPDMLLGSINILPIAMTIISLLTAYLYSSGMGKKEQYQLWALAIFFLVVLYNQSSGLLLYWTMNNIFYLTKLLLSGKATIKKVSLKELTTPIANIFDKVDKRLLYQVAIVSLILAVISFVVSRFLPEGVNYFFMKKSSIRFLAIALLIAIVAYFYKKPTIARSEHKIKTADLILLLLPLAPIVGYMVRNSDMISLTTNAIDLLYFSAISFTLALLLPFLIRRWVDSALLVSAMIGLLFILFYMPKLSLMFHWHNSGTLHIQQIALFALSLIIFLLYTQKRPLLYMLVVAFFMAEVGSSFSRENIHLASESQKRNLEIKQIDTKIEFKEKPNIYLIIYDSYPNRETLEGYGIDNSDQFAFLEKNGFKIYDGTYSIGSDSTESMGLVLSLKYTDNLTYFTAGNEGLVVRTLRENGYKINGIFDSPFLMRNNPVGYDYSFPANIKPESDTLLRKAISMGEFRFDTDFEQISVDSYMAEKLKAITGGSVNKQFLYAHGDRPGHTQNSGKCLPNEKDMFIEKLKKANKEMVADLNALLKYDPNAIVVVAGDHGPSLTKTCYKIKTDIDKIDRLDIQDRNGAFLAIRWNNGYQKRNNIQTIQDIFPEIFEHLSTQNGLFQKIRLEPISTGNYTSGVIVDNGIIKGGVNDGEPLFLNRTIK